MSDTHARLAVRWEGREIELDPYYPIQKDLREDAVNLAAICIPTYMQQRPTGVAPQPWMLRVARSIGELRNDGKRDKAFEDEVLRLVIRDAGFAGLSTMFGMEDPSK